MRSIVTPRRLAAVALLALVPCADARAQWITGLGEDAVVLPRGMVRTTVGGAFGGFDERFSSSTDGAPTSGRRGYGSELALDGTGVPGLASLDAALRAAGGTGLPGVTFGGVRVATDARRAELPVRFDVGVGARLQLFVAGAYVQTRTSVALVADPSGTAANVGANPALGDAAAAAQNASLVAGLRDAAATLRSQLAACSETPAAACADPDAATALERSLDAAAAGIRAAYGDDAASGVLVPAAGTPLADALDARLASLVAGARGLGVTALPADARPRHAAVPTSPGALLALADTGSAALGLPPLRGARRYGVSDIEVGARFRLIDPLGGRLEAPVAMRGTRLRAALTALVRLPTGEPDDPLDPLDVGTGDGQTDVEVGIAADVLHGRRFAGSVAARYGVQLADELDRAVPTVRALTTIATVTRDLGDYMELEVTPRWALSEYLTIGAHYRFRAKAEDAYELAAAGPMPGVPPEPDGTPGPGLPPPQGTPDVPRLGLGTETRQHVFGGGVVFSTLPAYAQARARWPVDIAYRRTVTVAGAGRLAERYAQDQVMLRVYLTPFGRP